MQWQWCLGHVNYNNMAKSENNEVMYGSRERVGNLVVFKNYGDGKTIISKVPRKRDNPVYSENQELAKERFREGVIYAKGAVQDPILSAFYKPYAKPCLSVYNLALADFCKPPQIKTIKTDGYQGKIGDTIIIRAIDNFGIAELIISICKPGGCIVETGLAVQARNRLDRVYTANVRNENVEDTHIKVKAADTPSNVTMLEQTLTV